MGVGGATKIAASFSQTCVVGPQGAVWCWGGSYGEQSAQVVEGAGPAQAVAVGLDHACALRRDGSVYCWGDNTQSMLGNGTVEPSIVPVQVSGLAGLIQLAAGTRHTCAVAPPGLLCWGQNLSSQLGGGTREGSPVPLRVPLDDVAAVPTGDTHTCAHFERRGPLLGRQHLGPARPGGRRAAIVHHAGSDRHQVEGRRKMRAGSSYGCGSQGRLHIQGLHCIEVRASSGSNLALAGHTPHKKAIRQETCKISCAPIVRATGPTLPLATPDTASPRELGYMAHARWK